MSYSQTVVFPSNSLVDVREVFEQHLVGIVEEGEFQDVFRWCVSSLMKLPFSNTQNISDLRISESQILDWLKVLKALKKGLPIQYALNEAWFCDLCLWVDERVLIPRPETEELVYQTQKIKPSAHSILDWCTGSGCIALAMQDLYPNAKVKGLEFSDEALQVAQKNGQLLNNKVVFEKADALQSDGWNDEKWDIILSNPPYITHNEKNEVQENVHFCEPNMALYVPNEKPLLFYEAIANYAQTRLNKEGLLAFEINPSFALETKEMLENKGYSVQLNNDFYEKERFAFATLNQ